MTMPCASIHRPGGHWPKEKAAGTLTLDFDARHRRRIRMTAGQGDDVPLELPTAIAMTDEDGLQLEDGKWLKVRAATFSPELADLTIYVIDRATLKGMEAGALRMRVKRPFIFTNLKRGEGVDQIASFVIEKGGLEKSSS
jgi:hypothetical protein